MGAVYLLGRNKIKIHIVIIQHLTLKAEIGLFYPIHEGTKPISKLLPSG